MKLTAILLFIASLHVSAKGLGQEKVSFSCNNLPLEKVCKAIRQQTGYVFFCSDEIWAIAKPVTVDVKNATVEEVLNLVMKNQPLEYRIENKTVAIKKKPAEINAPQNKSDNNNSPQTDITGRITNEQGEPLANANVTIKRTGTGTVTNANGQFTLRNINNDDILVISYVGYSALSIKVGDKTNLMLVMHLATNKLDEAVVQAYGKTTQRLATGDIAKITAEDISRQPIMNVLEVLQGQTPGTVVTNTSAYASGTVKVEIRGRNSINSSIPSDPLYIIDGVPLTILDITGSDSYTGGSTGMIKSGALSPATGQSPLFSVNPEDIESIEVLKDADATAIYGSRASNGVVLITTKRGKAGKTEFDVDAYDGIEKLQPRYKMLTTAEYVQMRKEALANDGLPVDIINAPDLIAWDTTRYTDWQKYLYGGTGRVTHAEGTISGGNAQTNFRVGAGFQSSNDVLAISGENKRSSLSFNFDHNTQNHRFGISLSTFYTYAFINTIASPANALLSPNAPAVYDANGNLNYKGWVPLDDSYPFGSILSPYTSKTNFLNSHLELHYELFKGFKVKTEIGYNNSQNSQLILTEIASLNPKNNPTGQAFFGNTLFHNLIVEPQLEYNTFIKSSKIAVLVGGSAQSNETSSTGLSGSGYTNDLLLQSINNAPVRNAKGYQGEYKYAALFGRFSYNYNNKYLLNLNARRDGSSKFGPGRQFGNFGAVGIAWIFTEESWLKRNVRVLSFGKIRGSYGVTGADQIADYSYLSQWSFRGNNYNGINPLVDTKHTDSTLQWEVNQKLEASISLGFLNDRIYFEGNWYRNRCNDQLVLFPLPVFSGFSSVTSNSPANVQNMGYELILRSEIVKSINFSWNFRFSFSQNRNRLLSYPNFDQSPYFGLLTIGKSLNLIKLLHYTGVDPQTGLYTFEDKNKDGKITVDQTGATSDDRYDYDRSVKFDGGIGNAFQYKNFEVSIFFYYRKQNGMNALANGISSGGQVNMPEEFFLNRWQKPGDIASFAKLTTNPGGDASYQNFYNYSDGIFTDASFIRLKNLSVSYSLKNKFIKQAKFKTCKLYVKGENLLLITKYKGSDPEIQSFGAPPIPKTFTVGLSCTF